ncbi:hypothetical protein [Enterobacter hormaechei]|uniref:hypothetical protein n=1 Tax=Enterobacter hormaechei TaxID=158836 RepID=UPI0026EDD794|nr:hypothetical protein [Enterobacter hormaechei]
MDQALLDNDDHCIQLVEAIGYRHARQGSKAQRKATVEEIRALIYVHPNPTQLVEKMATHLSRRGRRYMSDQQNWAEDLELLIRDVTATLKIREISDKVHSTLLEEYRKDSEGQTQYGFIELMLTYAPALPTDCVTRQLVRFIQLHPDEPHAAAAVAVTMIFRHLPHRELLENGSFSEPERMAEYVRPDQDPRLTYALYLADQLLEQL